MTALERDAFRPAEGAPLYQALYAHLRGAILAGELKGGARLPATRALAETLGLSRNTVLNAYDQLRAEGYLDGKEGSGTYVARVTPERLLTPAAARPPKCAAPPVDRPPIPPRLSTNAQRQLAAPRMAGTLPPPRDGHPRPFRFGTPAADLFPHELWARLTIRHARGRASRPFGYQSAAGLKPLREAIAAHATLSRRVRCSPEQVIVVSGSQGGLDLAARMLVNPGDPVWVEDPGYLNARGALLGAGARLVPVPMDDDGLDVEAGLARAPEARLVYVTPSHQFPLGVTLSLARRLALLDWAARTGAYLLEDDYDSEFRYAGRPLAALQGLDEHARVIYLGTFSKVLFPALRLGYLIVPPPLVEPFLAVRGLIDTHNPMLEQAVLADFIAEGHFARHLRRMRTRYAERRDALVDAARDLPLDLVTPETGLHAVAWLPPELDEATLVRRAAAHDVDLWPISRFCLEPMPRQGIVLGFAEYTETIIKAGVGRLRKALDA